MSTAAAPIVPPEPAGLRALTDGRRLQRRLARAAGRGAHGVLVGVACDARTVFAGAGAGARRDASTQPIRAGCLTKLLTAAAVERWLAGASASIGIDAAACCTDARLRCLLRGVTVKQLLEHSHGFADPAAGPLERGPDGRIDAHRLGRRIAAAGRLFEAGRRCSYGSAGPWLAAALIEQSTGLPYASYLRRELAAPLGIELARCGTGDAPDPATGGRLALSLAAWLGFLDHAADAARQWPTPADMTPLPGWHPLERGIYRGWKCLAGGWLGHTSVWPGASLWVRMQPWQDIRLGVASLSQPAAWIAARLFGTLLPEFAALRVPRPLTGSEARALDASRYTGAYRAGARVLSIDATDGALRLIAPRGKADLVPAAGGLFFTRPALNDLAYVQPVEPRAGGARFLWDGRALWARCG
jgi:CubicO group peptidase (beta-lactamase class C family)